MALDPDPRDFEWLFQMRGIEAVLLVGSCARGTQRADSDLDLVILASDPRELLVEYGLTAVDWASLDPIDSGTLRVINDGAKIWFDPKGILSALLRKASTTC